MLFLEGEGPNVLRPLDYMVTPDIILLLKPGKNRAGSYAYVVACKNSWVMKSLQKWNLEVFGNITEKIKDLQRRLQEVQINLQYGPANELLQEARNIIVEIDSWLEK